MMDNSLQQSIVDLYRETASTIPGNLAAAYRAMQKGNPLSDYVISNMLKNIDIAEKEKVPVCQDTGTPVFYVKMNRKHSMAEITSAIRNATGIATEKCYLRQNAADPFTGKNTCTNLGTMFPVIHFEEHEEDYVQIDLLLKGGGSENIGRTYSLPDDSLDAERDMPGIRKCVLDSVFRAQGRGCPPYIVSVGVGGSKEVVSMLSRKGLLREIGDTNPDPRLAMLEKELLEDINKLGIGPGGFGGKNTAAAVMISSSHRHPASFFVDVSFSCWALRRGAITWKE